MKPTATRASDRMPSQFRLDLSVAPGNAHEFDLWRSGMEPLFAMDAPDEEARSSFAVKMTSFQFADVAIIFGNSSAASFKRTAPMIARSGFDNICLLVYTKGGCVLNIEGHAAEVNAGDICFLDLSRRCTLLAPNYESLTLILPRAMLEPHVANLDDLHGRILSRSSPLNAMLFNHMQILFAEAASLNSEDAHAAASGTAALIAAFSGPSENGRDTIAQFEFVVSLHTLRRFVEDHLSRSDLGPDFICRHFGVSRATLYRAFQPVGGVSHYIHQRRLMRAYRMITDRNQAHLRVGAIAARCGFSNNSVFSRSFRQAYDMAPSELRSAQERTRLEQIEISNEAGFGTMSRWLLGLDIFERQIPQP